MQFWRLPLDSEKHPIPVGEVHIIADRCKGCNFCIEFCPNKVLVPSKKFNAKGYHPPEVVPEKQIACVNCTLCQVICPEFAIYSRFRMSKELSKQDIDRYNELMNKRRKTDGRE